MSNAGDEYMRKPQNVIATYVDARGNQRVIHAPKGRALKRFQPIATPAERLTRIIAVVVGDKVRQRRLELGLTPDEVSERSGLTRGKYYIQDIERAHRDYGVRIGTLYALAFALDCEPSDLLPDMAMAVEMAGLTTTPLPVLRMAK